MLKRTESLFATLGLGVVFVTLGSCRMLLIKFSANEDGKYEYLPITVTVCAEVIKLVVSLGLALPAIFVDGKPWKQSLKDMNGFDFLKWSIPGFLYFCDNLLAFYVIKSLQPALVVLLGNFVIITTSLLYRLILHRRLHHIQWASLVILFLSIVSLSSQTSSNLTVDSQRHHAVDHILAEDQENSSLLFTPTTDICRAERTQYQLTNLTDMGKELLESFHPPPKQQQTFRYFDFHEGHILILVQCILSSTANVYNEKIFKEGSGVEDSIYIQNSKLYFFGVIFNLIPLVTHQVYRQKILTCGFFYGHNAYSVVLMFVTALYGLNVAFILKFRDNMFHMLTSQLITVIIISASIYFFSFVPSLDFFVCAPIVLLSIYIFHSAKLKEPSPSDVRSHDHRMQRLHDDLILAEAEGLVISPDNMLE